MLCIYPGSMTLPTSNTTPEMLKALADSLRGKTICGVKIHDAKAKLSRDPDLEPCVDVKVLLDDPEPALRTWPTDVYLGIKRETRRIAGELNISEWPYITSRVPLHEAHLVGWTIPGAK